MKKTKCFLSVVIYILLQTCVECHVKLNVPRVRLPYFDHLSVNFTLQVDTPGCYRWSVSRPEIISISTDGVSPDDDETESLTELNGAPCSDRAIISTVPRASPCCPASAIVYAEDVVTKETVRCDVIIDKITAIYIRTTTKELHLEEAPSKFHIQAYGSKDNEFSTLDGIPFTWAVESYKETSTMIDPQSIMRYMPFSESPYKASPGVAMLEAKRQQGDTVLVEGIKTGSAVVVARITDPLYRSIDSRVRIVVVANLLLEPNEAFVVPGTVIPLKLIQIKHGQRVEISLPSNVYEFDVSNSTVANYNQEVSEVKALAYGETKIVVKDNNWVDGLEDEQPESLTSRIYVREPKFLSISVLPHKNWALVINQPYEIQVEIYDAENQRITVGDNIFVETIFDPAYFQVDYSSPNGTYHYGIPIKKGNAFVKAILTKITTVNGDVLEVSSRPKVKVEMEIFQSITINPKETILPWDPNVQPKYELRWNPSGGSGSFVWSSSNTSVVTVSQSGTGKTAGFGSVNVTVAASMNNKIKGYARVHVLPPTAMEIIPHIVEAEVGTAIGVPLAFYTVRPNDPNKTRVSYSSCGKLPFQVAVIDPNFEYDAVTHYPHLKPACAVLPITGKTLGSSLVHVKYSVGSLLFEDSVTVYTFKPLEVLEPSSKSTVLSVGSSRQVVFQGGPRPLLERYAGFERKLKIENETVALQREIRLEESSKDDLYVYEVTCKEIGATVAIFNIGNTKSSTAGNAVGRTAVVQVICAEPDRMYFKVETPLNSNCPNDDLDRGLRIAVPNYEPTLVSVIVKNTSGVKFDNISSLQVTWLSRPDLVEFGNPKYVVTEQIHHELGYIIPGKSYQKIVPKDKSGNIDLSAEIVGYRTEVLRTFSIRARKLSPQYEEESGLRHEMSLQLVSDVSVNPPSVNLFNHPSAKAVIKIQDGSGRFVIDSGTSSVADVVYHELNRTLEIQPMAQGSAKIRVKDLCINSKKDAEVTVDVNGVGYIQVNVAEEIQLGDDTVMEVSIIDHSGHTLSPEMLGLVKLQLIAPKNDALQIQQFGKVPTDNFLRYRVKGKALGETTITFLADGYDEIMGAGSVKSMPKTISVFPPLQLSPSNLIMLVGSVYQVVSLGGPQTNSQVKFEAKGNDEVLQVAANGLLTGKVLGKTVVYGQAIDTKSKKVYSEDQLNVEVVNLKAVRIVSPLTHILSNEKMPIRVVGISDTVTGAEIESALLVGGSSPIMTFEWSLTNKETGELIHPFYASGYQPSSGDQVQLQFYAKRPGTTTVKVLVAYQSKRFSAEVEISVVDQLGLLHYSQQDSSILMTPNSEINLKTNKDGDALVTYKLQCFNPKLFEKERSVITVDGNGIVRSNDLIGHAVVLITAVENFGLVQSRTVIVEVKRISYVMATPSLHANLKDGPTVVPRGVPILLTASYHDNTGRQFDSISSSSKARPSRTDVVQVDTETGNQTFSLLTLAENRVSIKIHDDSNSNLLDYLILSVGEAIHPSLPMNNLKVGDIVCFSCLLLSSETQSSEGRWSTSSSKILQINPTTGVAVAIGFGNVVVTYEIGSVTLQSQSINVDAADRIGFLPTLVPAYITNNSTSDIRHDIPVILDGKASSVIGDNCSEGRISDVWKTPFTCQITFANSEIPIKASELFDVQTVFLTNLGKFACRITPIRNAATLLKSSIVRSSITLTVKFTEDAIDKRLKTTGVDYSAQAASVEIKFNPAVYIHSPEVVITTENQVGTLMVTGLKTILDHTLLLASEDNYLLVKTPIRDKSKHYLKQLPDIEPSVLDEADTVYYPVRIKSKLWSSGFSTDQKLSLKLVSKNTQQTVEVPIKIKIEPGIPWKEEAESVLDYVWVLWQLLYSALSTVFGLLVLVIVVVIGNRVYRGSQKSTNQTMNTSVFVTSPNHQYNHGSPLRYSAPTPPLSANFSGSPLAGDSFAGGDNFHSPSLRLFSTQDSFSSPLKK